MNLSAPRFFPGGSLPQSQWCAARITDKAGVIRWPFEVLGDHFDTVESCVLDAGKKIIDLKIRHSTGNALHGFSRYCKGVVLAARRQEGHAPEAKSGARGWEHAPWAFPFAALCPEVRITFSVLQCSSSQWSNDAGAVQCRREENVHNFLAAVVFCF